MTSSRIAGLSILCALGALLAPGARAAEPTTNRPPVVVESGSVEPAPSPVVAISSNPPPSFAIGPLPLRGKPSAPPVAAVPPGAERVSAAAGVGATAEMRAREAQVDTAASLEAGDRLLVTPSPRQQREVLEFAESLPRFRADPAEDGFLRRAGEVVFPAAAEYRIGKVAVGGGLITAIRRRNPFGLLNPLFFDASW